MPKIDEKKQEEIRVKVTELLEKFSKELDKVGSAGENNVIRDNDRRKESKEAGKDCDKEFRKIMFENAPQHDDNFIIAEKKNW